MGMERYKVTVLRFGRAYVMAGTKEEAVLAAQDLAEGEIEWLSKKDGMPGGYLVTLVETTTSSFI